jgi:hypothetical protein
VVSIITVNYEVGGNDDGTIYGIEVGTAVNVKVAYVHAESGTEETANVADDHETGDHDSAGTVVMNSVGTEATNVDGTKVTNEAVTTMVFEPTQAKPVEGKVLAYVPGTTTGDVHESGTVTVDGIKTKLELATDTTTELGTVITADDETHSGTAVHGAMTVEAPTKVN